MSLSSGSIASSLAGAPPVVHPLPEEEQVARLRARLLQRPDVDAEHIVVVRAPLRISPLGAHIDHQLGIVTGMTIDRYILLAFVPTDDGRVELESLDFGQPTRFSLDAVPPSVKGEWGNYARGAVLALQQRHGLRRGLIGVVGGSMPIGGLSSSAAVTVAYLLALEAANDLIVDERENVEHCRYTENRYIGLNNGILDQSVILYSRHDQLTRIDCATVEVDNVPTALSPADLHVRFAVLAVYSGVTHALTGTDYNSRVAQCRDAAATLLARGGQTQPEDVRLRHVAPELFAEHGHTLDAPLAKRARHFFGEMARVEQGVAAWQRGDLAEMGRLVTASGESSIKWYECGSPQLVTLYEILAQTPGVLGTRFSGAGFRGNCLALIDPAHFSAIAEAVHRAYPMAHPEIADEYSIHLCRPDGRAALLPIPVKG
jgi:galactokinase